MWVCRCVRVCVGCVCLIMRQTIATSEPRKDYTGQILWQCQPHASWLFTKAHQRHSRQFGEFQSTKTVKLGMFWLGSCNFMAQKFVLTTTDALLYWALITEVDRQECWLRTRRCLEERPYQKPKSQEWIFVGSSRRSQFLSWWKKHQMGHPHHPERRSERKGRKTP